MASDFVRNPTCIECLYMDIDDCGYNMTFGYVLTLNEKPLLSMLNEAFAKTAASLDGVNLKFKRNAWYKSDFLPECTVRELEGEDLTAYKMTKINYRTHTVMLSVLHLADKDKWFLCFEFFHGAVDGRCALEFIYDFFAVINWKTPPKRTFSVVDMDIISQNEDKKQKTQIFPLCALESPRAPKSGQENTRIIKTECAPSHLSSKLCNAVAQSFTADKALMMIPVDIRKYAEGDSNALFGNFVLPLFVDASKKKPLAELQSEISRKVNGKYVLSSSIAKFFNYNARPKSFRKSMLESLISLAAEGERFPVCALVSSIGTVNESALSAKGLKVLDMDVFFEPMPFLAFTVISVKFDGHTSTSVGWHSGKVSKAVANEVVKSIENTLSSKDCL